MKKATEMTINGVRIGKLKRYVREDTKYNSLLDQVLSSRREPNKRVGL